MMTEICIQKLTSVIGETVLIHKRRIIKIDLVCTGVNVNVIMCETSTYIPWDFLMNNIKTNLVCFS